MRRYPAVLLAAAALLLVLAAPALALSVNDVLDMLDARVSEEVILDQIEHEGAVFDLTTDDILDLKRAGASDYLIKEMILTDERAPNQDTEDWTSGYYDNLYGGYDSARLRIVYDPFGYYWYSSPFYFAYYYPFSTCDFGFYYAGWYNSGWWGWNGRWTSYYWNRWHDYYRYAGYPGHRHRYASDLGRYGQGRHSWGRSVDGRGGRVRTYRGTVTRERPTTAPDRARVNGRTRAYSPPRSDKPGRTAWDRSRSSTPREREHRSPEVRSPSPRSHPSRSAPSVRSASPSRGRSSGSAPRSGGRSRGGWRR
jgi:hypothetical protein